jgi:hypothetical protein
VNYSIYYPVVISNNKEYLLGNFRLDAALLHPHDCPVEWAPVKRRANRTHNFALRKEIPPCCLIFGKRQYSILGYGIDIESLKEALDEIVRNNFE